MIAKSAVTKTKRSASQCTRSQKRKLPRACGVSGLTVALSVKYLISLDLTTPLGSPLSLSLTTFLPFSFSLVYLGSCGVSGCCHGGSLSSSLTSITLFQRQQRLYVRDSTATRFHGAIGVSGELPLRSNLSVCTCHCTCDVLMNERVRNFVDILGANFRQLVRTARVFKVLRAFKI